MKDDRTYLLHILEAIDKIQQYLGEMRFEEFADSDMVIDAVVRELEIIGEASRNLSDDFREQHSNAPLRDATDMRNILIHEYFDVNKKVVWDTCKNNLPQFRGFVTELLD